MYIERVLIRGLGPLRHRDDPLLRRGKVVPVCLRGVNGSGKSTWLLAVAELFRSVRRSASRGGPTTAGSESPIRGAELVAVLVDGLRGPASRLWLAHGTSDAVAALASSSPDVPVVSNHQDAVGVLRWWNEAAAAQENGFATGDQQILSNVVWFDALDRVSRRPARRRANARDGGAWLQVAKPTANGEELDEALKALKLGSSERWERLVDVTTHLFPGWSFADAFDAASQRPVVVLADGTRLFTDQLSAGEQAALNTLTMVVRWLTPEGVVLLDEPELHQHLSLVRANLALVERLVTDNYRGQLICASHAPEVWTFHRQRGVIIDLDTA